MNASRTHVTNWTSPNKNEDADAADTQFEPLNWNMNGLSNNITTERTVNATTFPQILKDAGSEPLTSTIKKKSQKNQ